MVAMVGTGSSGPAVRPGTQIVPKKPPVAPVAKPTMGPPVSSPTRTPLPTAQPQQGLLAVLQQLVSNQSGVASGQNALDYTNLQNQLALNDKTNTYQTDVINNQTGIANQRAGIANLANQQNLNTLNQGQALANTGYQNQLNDLMANMGFAKQQTALNSQYLDQQQQGLNTQGQQIQQGIDVANRNQPIQEHNQLGSEAAAGSASSGGYGQRLAQTRQTLQDTLAQYNLQKQNLQTSQDQLGTQRQQQGLSTQEQQLGFQNQQRDLALGQQQSQLQYGSQRDNLANTAKSLGIDKTELEQKTKQALDQLGLSTQISKEQIWQAFMDKQEGTYNPLSSLLSTVQGVMGLTPSQGAPVPEATPGSPAAGGGPTVRTGSTVYGNPQLQTQFSMQLANGLGIPPQSQQAAISMLNAWMQAEGNNTSYNPLSTTLGEGGATQFNSKGVKNYPSMDAGVKATLDTLTKSRGAYGYAPIVQALRSGDMNGFVKALGNSKWGSNAENVYKILGGK